ncbi:PTS sugar transporter subunit IIB [Clavibacter michiganensis]|nr:hypothetical protein [Clavibacter michiganensis]
MTGRILVVCGSGASSTFLAQRLRALAEADGLEIEAVAGSLAQVRLDAAGMDVVLLGAHLADRLDAVREAAADEGATAVLLADAAAARGDEVARRGHLALGGRQRARQVADRALHLLLLLPHGRERLVETGLRLLQQRDARERVRETALQRLRVGDGLLGCLDQARQLRHAPAALRGAGVLDVAAHVGDLLLHARGRVLEVGRDAVDAVEERAGLADRLLRRAHLDRDLAGRRAITRADRLGGLLRGVGREGEERAGLVDVAGDGRHRRAGVAAAEEVHRLLRPLDPGLQRLRLGDDGGEGLRRVLLERPELLERLGLRVELGARLLAEVDDARRPGAALLVGVLDRVVELLLQGERLADLAARRDEHLAVRADGAGSELRLGEAHLLLAGLERVVELHEHAAGALLSCPHLRERGLALRGDRLPLLPPADERRRDGCHEDRAQHEEEDEAEVDAGGVPGRRGGPGSRLGARAGACLGLDALRGGDGGP